MRRWTTWLLLGALAALASVAVADAVRGSSEPRKAAAPTITVPLIPRNEPASSAMGGVLYYSDRVDCRLRALRLPDLREVPAPELGFCAFSISPDGRDAFPGEAAWSPSGGLYARMTNGLIELGSPASERRLRFPGRAPAFKPDGTFTYARGNKVIEWTTACPRGSRLFTLPADNATARCAHTVARVTNGPVRSLVWLTDTRLALITAARESFLTIREGRLFVTTGTPGHRLDDLQVSPNGTYVSARVEGGGVLVVDADGHPVDRPLISDPISITWSPNERWTAVATESSVFLFRTNTSAARVRRLPVHAYQLAWR